MTDTADFDAARLALRRSILRDSFADFVVWGWPLVTGTPYVANTIAERLVATLQRVADGELTRVLIACPPGVGKSTLLTLYGAWRLARNAGHRAIRGSHGYELAATESRRLRRLVEGDAYHRMFSAVVLRDDENQAGAWTTTSSGAYFAVGVGGGLTGRRAHEALVDDALNAPDRLSKAARDACYTWFAEALATRLDGDRAPMLVVMQRLDRDDLIGRLIEQGGWHLVELPAETDEGELLAPNVLPREKLEAIKATIGAAAYATQYKERPSDDATALVKRVWWRFHRPAHVGESTPRPSGCATDVPAVATPERFDRIVIAVDMTFGGLKASNDYAVAQVWGSQRAGRYLLAQWRKRATQLEQRDAIRALIRTYPTAKILVEEGAGGHGAVEILRAEGFANVLGVKTGGKSKAQRFSLVSPVIEAGNCYLPLGAPWLGDFVEELAGGTKHDDMQDTVAYALADLVVHHSEWGLASGYLDGCVGAPILTVRSSDAPLGYSGGSGEIPYERRSAFGTGSFRR